MPVSPKQYKILTNVIKHLQKDIDPKYYSLKYRSINPDILSVAAIRAKKDVIQLLIDLGYFKQVK